MSATQASRRLVAICWSDALQLASVVHVIIVSMDADSKAGGNLDDICRVQDEQQGSWDGLLRNTVQKALQSWLTTSTGNDLGPVRQEWSEPLQNLSSDTVRHLKTAQVDNAALTSNRPSSVTCWLSATSMMSAMTFISMHRFSWVTLAVGRLNTWHQITLSEMCTHLLGHDPFNYFGYECQVGGGSVFLRFIRIKTRLLHDKR